MNEEREGEKKSPNFCFYILVKIFFMETRSYFEGACQNRMKHHDDHVHAKHA